MFLYHFSAGESVLGGRVTQHSLASMLIPKFCETVSYGACVMQLAFSIIYISNTHRIINLKTLFVSEAN